MTGFIYVLRCEGFAKIGFSRAPKLRLATANIMNPYEVSLVAAFEGTAKDERSLHARFASYRVKGEWFLFQGAVAEWVAGIAPEAGTDCVLKDWISRKRGRQTDLARALEITRGAVAQWDRVPAERLKAVSDIMGIPMADLRPDMFEAAAE